MATPLSVSIVHPAYSNLKNSALFYIFLPGWSLLQALLMNLNWIIVLPLFAKWSLGSM